MRCMALKMSSRWMRMDSSCSLPACTASIGEMADLLEQAGKEQELSIRIQREDIFNAMHRI